MVLRPGGTATVVVARAGGDRGIRKLQSQGAGRWFLREVDVSRNDDRSFARRRMTGAGVDICKPTGLTWESTSAGALGAALAMPFRKNCGSYPSKEPTGVWRPHRRQRAGPGDPGRRDEGTRGQSVPACRSPAVTDAGAPSPDGGKAHAEGGASGRTPS